ncbi:MAG TPA: hypothetical protein VII41_05620 [Steroidobacteraceae bacterium]
MVFLLLALLPLALLPLEEPHPLTAAAVSAMTATPVTVAVSLVCIIPPVR